MLKSILPLFSLAVLLVLVIRHAIIHGEPSLPVLPDGFLKPEYPTLKTLAVGQPAPTCAFHFHRDGRAWLFAEDKPLDYRCLTVRKDRDGFALIVRKSDFRIFSTDQESELFEYWIFHDYPVVRVEVAQ